jgi:predicted acylesterase/phospholipase RssA
MKDKAMKLWVVLVGGGACGEYQAGVIKKIEDQGWLPFIDGIVGTSVGGLNGSILAKGIADGVGAKYLETCWLKDVLRDEDVFVPAIPDSGWQMLNPITGVRVANMARRFVFDEAALDSAPLHKLIDRYMGKTTTFDVFEKTGIQLYARAYNYEAGCVHTLEDQLADISKATSAIEGAFKPWKGYGDGGVGDNAPIMVAVKHGATHVIVIYTGPETIAPKNDPVRLNDSTPTPKKTTGLKNILNVAGHLTSSNEDLVWEACQNTPGVEFAHVYSSTDNGSFLDFKKRGLWKKGYEEGGGQLIMQLQVRNWPLPNLG